MALYCNKKNMGEISVDELAEILGLAKFAKSPDLAAAPTSITPLLGERQRKSSGHALECCCVIG